jgi:endoglucanase
LRRFRLPAGTLAALATIGGVVSSQVAPAGATSRTAHAAYAQQCGDPHSAHRNPANPLLLPATPPRGNPLRGARFFVNGPAHGAAAGEIARLLGIDSRVPVGQPLPSFRDSDSWAAFAAYVRRRLPNVAPATARKIRLLTKIAAEPEAQRISYYSWGGTPEGIFKQTQKLFCHNFTADRGAVPIINTYFLHARLGGCPTHATISAYKPLFQAQIDALAAGIARRPAVLLLEVDGVGSTTCVARNGQLRVWESMLRYEATTLAALPHTVVYLEGGYSDSRNARWAARILNAAGVRGIQGFFTNDTHLQWTSHEIRYGEQISRLTGGAHFIVNTAQNGHGPLLNPHPSTQGVEDLCNPPGRGLGPRPTTTPGFSRVDAFLWTSPPGNSSGCGGGPPGGVFWPARAEALAARANGKLGPGYPSRPY